MRGERPDGGGRGIGAQASGASDGPVWEGKAPAKVNLTLRVLAREAGGFHQIETIFQALELADELRIELADELRIELEERPGDGGTEPPRIELEMEGVGADALGRTKENLAVRAARLYCEALVGAARNGWSESTAAARVRPPVGGPDTVGGEGEGRPDIRIHLAKRIPHGAGLGGGSSDAAAVLRGLDELYSGALGRERLVKLGAELGADVAFFVLHTPRALAWGRGDRLQPLPALPRRPVLLALPPDPIGTPWAYRMLAEYRKAEGEGAAGGAVLEPSVLETWEGMAGLAENAFQAALEPLRPELAGMRRTLEKSGAEPALLSGSGSAVFGVFSGEAAARAAEEALREAVPGLLILRTATAERL